MFRQKLVQCCTAAALVTTPLMLSVPISGWAQIEEIVVTARRREESLQEVPLAVEVFNRDAVLRKGINSVAAPGFQAPGVVVSYTEDEGIKTGKKFAEMGIQIAAGVPLRCDEPEGFQTFRLGLFGLDKLQNIDRTVEKLEEALGEIL